METGVRSESPFEFWSEEILTMAERARGIFSAVAFLLPEQQGNRYSFHNSIFRAVLLLTNRNGKKDFKIGLGIRGVT